MSLGKKKDNSELRVQIYKKLMGWCPTKNSLQNQMQEGCLSNFKLESGNIQLSSSPADLQEGRLLKVQASPLTGGGCQGY